MSEKPLSMGNTPLAPPVPSRPSTAIRPQARRPHDPAVMFEEYHYYALRTRAEEESLPTPKTDWREIVLRKKPEAQQQREEQNPDGDSDEYSSTVRTFPAADLSNEEKRLEISDREWTDASRAFRSASWGACFYLITTDILGPYVSALSVLILPSDKAPNVDGTQGVGFALGTLGWGPGIALYTVFGFMAGYSGYLIWHMFLGLDSHEFPARNYGDIAFRIYGNTARYVLNSLQALALILILGQVTIQNGQAISQVSKFRLCYAVCPVLFICAGFLLGQIRTLRSYGWVANFAVWLNLLVIFITMGVMAHSPPNFQISTLGSAGSAVAPDTITPDANGVYPPVRHYGGLPDPSSLVGSLNGLLSGVLAYSGAQLFVEFMAEMRRPRDFLKAMWGAQFFIYAVYLIYGCYVYFWQGQYAYQVSYQGVSSYGWQTAGNMLALISGLIAAGLYSRQHWHQSTLQQRPHRHLQRTASHHAWRQDPVGHHRAPLVDRRLHHRRRHPGLFRLRQRHVRRHPHAPRLLLPALAHDRLRHPPRQPAFLPRRRVRPAHRRRPPRASRSPVLGPRLPRRQPLASRHERPASDVCPRRARDGRLGPVRCHRGHD
nr:hypothetical protein CFP56_30663 [Quercus suber]